MFHLNKLTSGVKFDTSLLLESLQLLFMTVRIKLLSSLKLG